jgi:L-alanine-DL-glutamate epimerase-like enolase superfamily enzyme
MEIDPDVVPWQHDLFTVKPTIKDGYMLVPEGPGWGTEVNEAAVRTHPPKGDW